MLCASLEEDFKVHELPGQSLNLSRRRWKHFAGKAQCSLKGKSLSIQAIFLLMICMTADFSFGSFEASERFMSCR
jgi:hypothetical protein